LKRSSATIFLAVLIVIVTLMIGTVKAPLLGPPEGTLALFDAVDMDDTVTWFSGSEPGTYPYFNVKVMVTNVSQMYSIVFSVVWDPAILDLTGITKGDATYNDTKTMFGPSYAEWNRVTGVLRNWLYGQLSPDAGSAKTFADPVWGWVATLTFKFVGTPPVVGSPVDTYINLTYIESEDYKTGWYKVEDYLRRPFLTLRSCHFYYEALVHDLAVISVVPSTTEVTVGDSIDIDVTVKNEGNFTETFDVSAYYDSFLIETKTGISLVAGASTAVSFTWTTTSTGSFLIKADVPAVSGEDDTGDNIREDGTVVVLPVPVHDIAITNITASSFEVDIRDPSQLIVTIGVEVTNEGDFTETFNVTIRYDSTDIDTKTVFSLSAGDSTTVYFDWNVTGVELRTYKIEAEAILEDDYDLEDNAKTSDWSIEIVPEFPMLTFLLLLMIATLAATVVGKKFEPHN